jgi:hypothetical protein
MIKRFVTALSFLVIAFTTSAQIVVKVDVEKNELKAGDTLQFHVAVEQDEKLEIAFFADTKLVFHQNSLLKKGTHDFSVPIAESCLPGEYYVLVTGKDIHEQRMVYIR